ncbi:MAG: oxygen-independent coproporphyrinogen III oxidase [Euryarchaeota archaeon]|nr:oxygen-independent coproporphyrinogen III oxidase [Euryarchaeota archaeon]
MKIDAETVRRFDVPGPRYTSYPTVPQWTETHGAQAHERALAAAASSTAPLALYVHIPFCAKRCLFCGCNTHITRDPNHPPVFIETLLEEARRVAERLGTRRSLRQLHLGGGTPTHLTPDELDSLLSPLLRLFPALPDAELGIEVHPAVTTTDHIDMLARHGFDRISMGVQDFDPQVQDAIRRHQSVAETQTLIEHARAVGFSGVNLDLIYGLPHQTPGRWTRTLDAVIGLRPDRLALYSYAHLPSRFPHQAAMPERAMPKEDGKVRLFLMARDRFLDAGYEAIGFDHFALPTDDLARGLHDGTLHRNFMGYTTRHAPDLVALGPSAISQVGPTFAQNDHALAGWAERVCDGRLATVRGIALSADDLARRDAIEGFLCRFVLDVTALRQRHGPAAGGVVADIERNTPEWEAARLVEKDGALVRATGLGRLFARNIAMGLDAYLDKNATAFSRTV